MLHEGLWQSIASDATQSSLEELQSFTASCTEAVLIVKHIIRFFFDFTMLSRLSFHSSKDQHPSTCPVAPAITIIQFVIRCVICQRSTKEAITRGIDHMRVVQISCCSSSQGFLIKIEERSAIFHCISLHPLVFES